MISKSILNANVSTQIGSRESKALRKNNMIPAILYGKHIDNQALELDKVEVIKHLKANSIESSVYLQIIKVEVLAIVKDFQRDLMTRQPIHIDFQALTICVNIKENFPIHYLGNTNLRDGLILQTFLDHFESQTIPKYLIDKAEIDLSDAELGDTVHIKDLPLVQDEHIEILTDATLAVYAIAESNRFIAVDEPVVIPEQ